MDPATIVVLVLTAFAGILLVLVEIRSRRNIAREKQQQQIDSTTSSQPEQKAAR